MNQNNKRRKVYAALIAVLLGTVIWTHTAAALVIKLGTVAPEGSAWHDALLNIRQQWRTISNNEVELRVYAGGVLGGESEMVRKLQRRGIDAIAISGAGMPLLDASVDCLNIPLLFDSYEALDYIRSGLSEQIERRLLAKRLVLLSWAEAGWVHFFTKVPVRTPEELRTLRLWIAAGHPETEVLYKEFGFRVVPLSETDMLTALQTGMIDAIQAPPLFALLDRTYQSARYMTNLRFAPLNAATVVDADTWNRVPKAYRAAMLEAARAVGAGLRQRIRQAGDDAVREMQSRGLEVVGLDEDVVKRWRVDAEKAYPRLPCNRDFPELFQRVIQLNKKFAATERP